jgi:hypothetical protein
MADIACLQPKIGTELARRRVTLHVDGLSCAKTRRTVCELVVC